MGLDMRNLSFDNVSFKPACSAGCSATETRWKIEISLVVSLDIIISNKPCVIRLHDT